MLFYLTSLGSKELNISLALGGFLSLIHPSSLPPPPPQLFKQHMEKTEQMSFMLLTKWNSALLLEIIVRFKIIWQHPAVYKLGLFAAKIS